MVAIVIVGTMDLRDLRDGRGIAIIITVMGMEEEKGKGKTERGVRTHMRRYPRLRVVGLRRRADIERRLAVLSDVEWYCTNAT
jgi:hypothetical protein